MLKIIVFLAEIVISVKLIATILTYLIYRYGNMNNKNFNGCIKMSLSQFKDYYPLDPEKWRYDSLPNGYFDEPTSVRYLIYNPRGRWGTEFAGSNYECRKEIVRVHLSFFDWWQLRRMFNSLEAEENNAYNKEKNKEALERFITSAQEDIEALKKKSDKEIEESVKTIEKSVRK